MRAGCVAYRDTDSDWRRIGEEQPFWGVASLEPFRTENLNDQALTDFYRSGHADIQLAVDRIARVAGCWPAPRRALDFGCGVGRLAFAMTQHAGEVVGYDVSPAMLRQAEARNDAAVTFTDAWPSSGFDWINSYIVFQHIPPERGLALLGELLKLLNPGGVISLHFAIYRDARLIAPRSRLAQAKTLVRRNLGRPIEPALGSGSMYDYDLDAIFAILVAAGSRTSPCTTSTTTAITAPRSWDASSRGAPLRAARRRCSRFVRETPCAPEQSAYIRVWVAGAWTHGRMNGRKAHQ
jgi:SAM-dependent methyltransferase